MRRAGPDSPPDDLESRKQAGQCVRFLAEIHRTMICGSPLNWQVGSLHRLQSLFAITVDDVMQDAVVPDDVLNAEIKPELSEEHQKEIAKLVHVLPDLERSGSDNLIGPAEIALTRIPSGPRFCARYRTLASRLALARPITL